MRTKQSCLSALQVTNSGCRVHLSHKGHSNIPIGGSISPESFVSSTLLLVVIIVTVVIVVVILVVVVVIVGVVIVVAIIRVVVVGGVSPILRLSFVIIGSSRTGLLLSGHDPTDEDGDTGMDDSTGFLASLGGEISSGRKKSQESNSDNTGGTTVGEAIRACIGGIGNSSVASYAYMSSIYESSCKGEKTTVAKRYLVKSFEESGEVFLGKARK
uniref:Uncharacterized protein n=1 Tax=Tanacetum cinerariifolium TaxID=118510 RepID=A0A699JGD5_TANCI|nr:hypothetical protein [Tanacetum cinerariifolium]